MPPPATIKVLAIEATTSDDSRSQKIVIKDMSPTEVCEVVQHALSALFSSFDVKITPVNHTPPTEP